METLTIDPAIINDRNRRNKKKYAIPVIKSDRDPSAIASDYMEVKIFDFRNVRAWIYINIDQRSSSCILRNHFLSIELEDRSSILIYIQALTFLKS